MINSSYMWSECTVFRLTKNMRLQNMTNPSDSYDLKIFSDWIASISDGVAGESNDGHVCITIPEYLLIHTDGDPIARIVEIIFPEYVESAGDVSCLRDHAILAPTLTVVEAVNDYMTALNVGEVSRTYLSSDNVSRVDSTTDLMTELHTLGFLNCIKLSSVPNHVLTLKVGTLVMPLRNIDHSMDLCNGAHLILTRLGDHVLEGEILTGVNTGQKVLIPRLSLTPSDTSLPFKFHRRQYPIMTSYTMTINKSQGQSLSRVGLLLKKLIFTHRQLYVAVSRVTNRRGLKILIVDEDEGPTDKTENVVFKEVFNNV
ncbi:unnamed protein product [Cuscuta epithymum]|uniref:ATP-dependent DNA helicase n=1 Tax=Cuscuta epithymum TaxID=186058 RepID=A0AAV0DMH3_9ASTE|nr:unnamed protein product [Cuscuta epithymum]CAH9142025.1 unnamed protein product [Cuscuta epithymum]